VKQAVYERDGGRCVLCGRSYGAFPNAHFIARSHGGLGVEENILTLCIPCHHRYDNSADRAEIREELEKYLRSKYPGWDESKLTYRKWQFGG
jgi:5-methylcytosine-specific restriction endonuclease McrA